MRCRALYWSFFGLLPFYLLVTFIELQWISFNHKNSDHNIEKSKNQKQKGGIWIQFSNMLAIWLKHLMYPMPKLRSKKQPQKYVQHAKDGTYFPLFSCRKTSVLWKPGNKQKQDEYNYLLIFICLWWYVSLSSMYCIHSSE